MGLPVLAIPGNHDIGEVPKFARLGQPITPDLIAAWHRQVGAQYWVYDIGAWRLVGLDTALMGSGLPQEAAQKAVFPAVQANAWLLFEGGKAKVSPDTVGIPKP